MNLASSARNLITLAALTTALLLTGCGGGGGGTAATASAPVAAAPTFTIGGAVSGLFGSGLVLQNNAGDDLLVNADGSFVFAAPLTASTAFAVTVKTQPKLPAQTCTTAAASGTVATSNVTSVTVTCVMALSAPKYAYVANLLDPSIQPFTVNATTGAINFVPVVSSEYYTPLGTQPISVAVDPTGKFLYGSDFAGHSLLAYTINPATGKTTQIAGGNYPTGARLPYSVAVDPTGKFIYVANQQDSLGGTAGTISAFAINSATGALTAVAGSPFTAGVTPFAVAVDPKGKFVYVANSGTALVAGTVSAFSINATSGALTPVAGSPFAFGLFPLTLAVDPTGRVLAVTGTGGAMQSYAINPSTGALTIQAPNGPGFALGVSIAYDPTGRYAYVANFTNKTVMTLVFNAAGLPTSSIAAIPAGDGPVQVAVDPSGKFVYVANRTNGLVAGGAISAFSINTSTGALTPLAVPSVGAGASVRAIALTR